MFNLIAYNNCQNSGSYMNTEGEKGVQKNLSFSPIPYLFSFKKFVIAISMKCVRLRYLIPSASLSTLSISSVGRRIVTLVVSLFDIKNTIRQLNINTCNNMHLFARQFIDRSGSAWKGIF